MSLPLRIFLPLASSTGLAIALSAALLGAAEATLLSAVRTANDPDAPHAVKEARAFPRRLLVALWLLRDLLLVAAAAGGIALVPSEPWLAAAALVALALLGSLGGRAFVARVPQAMRGPVWPLALRIAPLARLEMSAGRRLARRVRGATADTFCEGDAGVPGEGSDTVLDPEERDLLVKVRAFGSRQVREVMTPRVEIFSLPDDISPLELLTQVNEARFARVPIYHGEKDNVVGILYVKDLLGRRLGEGFNMGGILHRATVVPPEKPVDEVFRELRRSKVHIALVIDELGSLVGLVTMEDILEELFGKIRDDSDEAEPEIERRGTALVVPGRLPMVELASVLDRPIEVSGDETTVGGVLIAQAGKVPREGDRFGIDGLNFTVERREGTVLKRIRVEPATC
ncbi:MAG TPA: hemolysin family protein [Candidatus Bathyarchaeia archaeon]|nr:hemolysin family protein [Candidatus Bathyarchaeia archaeon]